MKNYGQKEQFVPLLAPVDITTSATATPYVDLKGALDCTFIIPWGVITTTSADQVVTVTVEASSAATSNATEAAIAFNYRLSTAIGGTDSLGAVTAATSAGYGMRGDADAMMLIIEVDPAAVQGATSNLNGRFVRVVLTPGSGETNALVAVIAVLHPSYAGNTMVSSS
jgi:hypothetical protein